VQLVSKIFNLCGHDPPTSQTDKETTCNSKTALCTVVHRAIKNVSTSQATWAHSAVLISVSIALSQTPAYAVRPPTWLMHCVLCPFTPQLSPVPRCTAWWLELATIQSLVRCLSQWTIESLVIIWQQATLLPDSPPVGKPNISGRQVGILVSSVREKPSITPLTAPPLFKESGPHTLGPRVCLPSGISHFCSVHSCATQTTVHAIAVAIGRIYALNAGSLEKGPLN